MRIEKIPTIWLPLTYRCNNKCSWCYAEGLSGTKEDLSDKNEREFLNFFQDLGVKKIVLIGGEPTLYKNIFKLISELSKRDIRVGMVTNGRKLSEYEFCKTLKESGIYSLTVSLEGSNGKLHDKVTKIEGSFKQSLNGLENSIKCGINTSTETVMTRDNEDDLEEIVSLVEKYDLKQSAFSICGPCISDIKNSKFSLTLNEGAKMFERVFQKSKYKERTKLITSSTICSFDGEIYSEIKKNKAVSKGCHIFTGSRFVLEPNGDLLPCVHFAGFPIFNIIKNGGVISAESFLKEYNSNEGSNQKFRRLFRRYPSIKCKQGDCWGEECSGGCPVFWLKYDPSKEIKGFNF